MSGEAISSLMHKEIASPQYLPAALARNETVCY
jgi:hypothetical protein